MFPATVPVVHVPFLAVTQDQRGNDALTYSAPASIKAIAVRDHRVETTVGGHVSRVVADVDLALPPMPVSVRDRFVIDNHQFEVVGVRDNGGGHHGWQPGVVAELKRVTG